MLRIESLSKTYKGGKKAVDKLSLRIHKGDIYGFIGHNGAGKTTTIKCITGILDFDEGEIFIDGKSIKDDPIGCKRLIAYIPDNPDLYDNMTGIQYLNFISDIFGISKESRERNIEKFSDAFELTKNLGDLISSYSHGMKQKLAVISALIHEPKLLILDEPFVGLDPKASHTLKEFMKEMCQRGSAIFFSTHVLEVAEKLCNKIAIIKAGKIIASGETEKVKGDSSLEQLFLEVTDNE
ncbi:ABC-type transporter ATP-binding protein ecsA [Proteiniborus sp. DW1]|uniref:ABC transporter ATP-binding protein n=1 Tax=Proteiniborus sp. DW1 TaxID=1889883 RepID=UPI00092E0B90|nr:ABC transporter ATP-binding protein [Proteiniborus sp. DW1]SCG82925.1 ABC-type transporter ATP-binding protein ecsA [Proteiniborus sp. DW1]